LLLIWVVFAAFELGKAIGKRKSRKSIWLYFSGYLVFVILVFIRFLFFLPPKDEGQGFEMAAITCLLVSVLIIPLTAKIVNKRRIRREPAKNDQ
jgi:Na+/melibiose symporter-like transporter